MATNCPEARAFRTALEVLEDRNNRIGRKRGVRVLVYPSILEHGRAVYVIYLIEMLCFSIRVGYIGV
jgi:hypothetical protein